MKQTRLQSLTESATDIAIGFVISLLAGMVIFPLNGMPFSFESNLLVTMEFTVVSMARRYVVRRWFNQIHSKQPT